MIRLQFIDKERILLLVTCVLGVLLQVVEVAQVLLPSLVDVVEHDNLEEGLAD